jgi:hypothetical protein
MKILNVTVMCQAYYNSYIEVPDGMTFDEAIEYAKEHIEDIPINSPLEYVPCSDELDVENCDFEEDEEE